MRYILLLALKSVFGQKPALRVFQVGWYRTAIAPGEAGPFPSVAPSPHDTRGRLLLHLQGDALTVTYQQLSALPGTGVFGMLAAEGEMSRSVQVWRRRRRGRGWAEAVSAVTERARACSYYSSSRYTKKAITTACFGYAILAVQF